MVILDFGTLKCSAQNLEKSLVCSAIHSPLIDPHFKIVLTDLTARASLAVGAT